MRILIVDDQPAAREMLRLSLEHACGEISIEADIAMVEGGLAALKHLAQNEVDLLVCDLHMPDLTGMDVLAYWQEQGTSGVAVVSSTMASERDREKALALGAMAVWEKPITMEQCTTLLKAVLG